VPPGWDCPGPASAPPSSPGAGAAAPGSGSPVVVITFDDGFRNALEYGLPILARHGFRAIQFLLPDLLGKTNTWEQAEGEAPEPLMDEAQVRDWLAVVIDWLAYLQPSLADPRSASPGGRGDPSSKHRPRTGLVPIEHFCYPGDRNEPA
jgi:peptidoglycan/xylan/chitin deacetylase (PgdA/CDA1 family)